MHVSELSTSTQNYLKVIWNLHEWSDEAVTASAVAEGVGLRLSTVSDAMRRLTEQGLVEHAPYGNITLTEAGRAHAVAMVRRHRLIESFLVRALGYGWDEVHEEAETLEHAVSDLMVDRIDDFLGHPTKDPHGDPIPGRDGRVPSFDAVVLTEAPVGHEGRIIRISDRDPALLRAFAEQGAGPGTEVCVAAGGIVVDGGRIVVPDESADAVWISRER